MKDLYTTIREFYPDITDSVFIDGTIVLQNDSNGKGDYIKEWNYIEPINDVLVEYLSI